MSKNLSQNPLREPEGEREASGREAFDEAMRLQSIVEEKRQSTPASQPTEARMGS